MIIINPSGALIFIDVRLTDWHYSFLRAFLFQSIFSVDITEVLANQTQRTVLATLSRH